MFSVRHFRLASRVFSGLAARHLRRELSAFLGVFVRHQSSQPGPPSLSDQHRHWEVLRPARFLIFDLDRHGVSAVRGAYF